METVSIACPLLNTYSALFDVRSLDPSRILLKLSKGLSPRDTVTFYGTLDSTATDASANLTLLGSLPGNNGDPSSALSVSGWPFLFAFRSAGTSPGGSIIASGNENGAGGSLAPPSVALPALNAYSTVIDLSPLAGNEFLIGLDANQTSRDTFNIYGTNDATAGGGSGAAGGQILGTLHGGDGASGTALITNGFRYVFFQRTGGSTAGSAFAWGTSVSAGGGFVESVSVTAPIVNTGTALNPNIGITAATDSASGSMSASDKTKLDGIYGWNVREVTFLDSPVTAAPGDYVLCDTTGGAINITGPNTKNAPWGAQKVSSDLNAVDISATAGMINGLATQTIGLQWGSYMILGNGTGANIIATT